MKFETLKSVVLLLAGLMLITWGLVPAKAQETAPVVCPPCPCECPSTETVATPDTQQAVQSALQAIQAAEAYGPQE